MTFAILHAMSSLAGAIAELAPALANHLWQSTAFAVIAGLLTLALRRNDARVRFGLWLAASMKFLVPFALLAAIGGHLARPRPVTAPAPVLVFAVQDFAQPFELPAPPSPTPQPHRLPMRELIALVGALVWAVGFFGVLARWVVCWLRIRQTLRCTQALTSAARAGSEYEHASGTAEPLPLTGLTLLTGGPFMARSHRDMGGSELPLPHPCPADTNGAPDRVLPILRRIEAAAELSPMQVRITSSSMEPGVFGIFRPVLAWPVGLSEQLSDAQLEAILAHEVAHLRRRDNLYAALHMLVEAVFWFHPLVWFIGARMLTERERACDEAVTELCPRPEAYAEGILKVCEFCIESPLACVSGITGADLKRRITHIMTGRAMQQLSRAKKVALVCAGVFILAVPIAFGLIRLAPVYEQILHPTGPLPSFEVVSIRPWQPRPLPLVPSSDGTTVRPKFPMKVDPAAGPGAVPDQRSDRVNFIGNAQLLIASAYNVAPGQENKILGAPEWATREANRYKIQAKIEDSMYTAMQKMNPMQQREQVQLMEQSLLAERFKLKVHFETRQMPVYALVVAPGGPKLTPAKDGEINGIRDTREDEHGTETVGTAVTLDQFVHSVILFYGRPIVDETGLNGKYDFKLTWGREQPDVAGSEQAGPDAPPLFTAIEQQLGLKLVRSKAPIEVIVVDHIDPPSIDGAELVANPQSSASKTPAAPAETPKPNATTTQSQTQPAEPAKALAFEVVSIRQHKTGGEPNLHATPDGWVMTDVPLAMAIQSAYVPQSGGAAFFGHGDVLGLPAWAMQDRYDINARVSAADLADWQNPRKQPAMLHAMLQAALVERCGLKVHRETKEAKVLKLVVGNASKLKPTDPNTPHPNANTIPGGGSIVVEDHGQTLRLYNATMSLAATLLSSAGGVPVQDRTGLTGRYDLVLREPDPLPAQSNDAAADDPESRAYSIAEGAGFILKPSKGQVETLVVDHVDRPTEN